MNQGVYPLTASMVNQINRLDQISNNLANADTFGFKQEGTSETTFNWYLKRMQEEQQNPFVESITINNIPVIIRENLDIGFSNRPSNWSESKAGKLLESIRTSSG